MRAADVQSYLQRIGYRGDVAPSLATLRDLHVAHLRTVPFENLSVRRGEPIPLDPASLHRKIVGGRRGGFCYELNGHFAALLESRGFRLARLAGRVGVHGIPFDHLALRVDLDEPWLADVGFGDSFLVPLRLGERAPQDGGDGRRYRLVEDVGGLLLVRDEDGWKRQYLLAPEPWPLAAFEPGCEYHRTSPRSTFTQRTVVSRATGSGRVTLAERRLIVTDAGGRTERTLPDDAAVARALEEHFGIRDGPPPPA